MKNMNFVVVDLVKNEKDEMLAVSVDGWGCPTYHYLTAANIIDEDNSFHHIFKRKADIKKVRSSKEKSSLIDKINLEILKNNVGAMAFALEQASDKLIFHLEKQNICVTDTFADLPESLSCIGTAGKEITKGLNNYSNYLKLCMDSGVGIYALSITRMRDHA